MTDDKEPEVPYETWVFDCNNCCNMIHLYAIGTTEPVRFIEQKCDTCGMVNKVWLPEQWMDEDPQVFIKVLQKKKWQEKQRG